MKSMTNTFHAIVVHQITVEQAVLRKVKKVHRVQAQGLQTMYWVEMPAQNAGKIVY